jgi:hypothetical protein
MASGIPAATKTAFLAGQIDSTDTFKAALFTSSWSEATATYSTTNECPATGNYTQGGVTMTGWTVSTSGTKGIIDAADVQWANLTASFRYIVIWDDTNASDRIVAYYDVGAQSVTGTTVNVIWPTANDTSAMIRFA